MNHFRRVKGPPLPTHSRCRAVCKRPVVFGNVEFVFELVNCSPPLSGPVVSSDPAPETTGFCFPFFPHIAGHILSKCSFMFLCCMPLPQFGHDVRLRCFTIGCRKVRTMRVVSRTLTQITPVTVTLADSQYFFYFAVFSNNSLACEVVRRLHDEN